MKNNSKFKKSRIVVPALALAVLTTTAAATSTVAWFSANNKVTASGMSFKAQATSNLFISKAKTNIKDGDFSTGISYDDQAVTLAPSSTVDAKSFFTTSQANGAGDALQENYSTADNSGEKKAFVDYHFQLKATNVDGTNTANIYLSKLNLLYNTESNTTIKAWRVGFLISDALSTATDTTGYTNNKYNSTFIYSEVGSANFSDASATISTKTGFTNHYAVKNTTELGDVAYVSAATALIAVPAKSTKYYDVVARVWLEGEDTTCNDTVFNGVTSDWTLEINLEMGDNTAVGTVVNIASTK